MTGAHSGKSATAALTVTAGPVAAIVLSPASASIEAGGSQAYATEGRDEYGNSLGDVTASTTFTIAPDGSCVGATCGATSPGTHTVTGTHAGKTATAELAVTEPTGVDYIVVSPASASVAAGAWHAFTAEAFDASNNSLGDVTASTTFTIAPNGSCVGASCSATAAGAHTVTGTYSGTTAAAALTVMAGPLAAIVVSPASASIPAGGSQAYAAEGRDEYGNSLGDVTTSTTFTIAPSGSCSASTCTAPTGGSYTVTGTNAGKTATAALSVDYVRNPGFEVDLAGWNQSSSGAGVTLTRVSDPVSGSWVAKLTNTGTTAATATLQDSPNWVAVSSSGTYTGRIWVRADTSGARVKVRFREYSGGVLAGSASVDVGLTTVWQQVTVNYAIASTGSTLDFQAYVTNAAPGTVFYADNVSIVHAG